MLSVDQRKTTAQVASRETTTPLRNLIPLPSPPPALGSYSQAVNANGNQALLLRFAQSSNNGQQTVATQSFPPPPASPVQPPLSAPVAQPVPQFQSTLSPVQQPPNPLSNLQYVVVGQPSQPVMVLPPLTQATFDRQPTTSQLPFKPTVERLQERLRQNRAQKKNGKHLVLDLDETLVHTFDTKDNFTSFAEDLTDDQKSRVYQLKFPGGEVLWGYVRPYAEDFLRVAFEEFDTVGVWSAGTSYYVNLIVEIVFKGQQQPVYVMSRDQCNELILKKEPMPCRFKPLEILYHRYPDHNEANTVIVDDRIDICSLNCMNNIRIPEFLLTNTSYPTLVNDTTLLVLADWFQSPEFRASTSIKSIKGRSPFKI